MWTQRILSSPLLSCVVSMPGRAAATRRKSCREREADVFCQTMKSTQKRMTEKKNLKMESRQWAVYIPITWFSRFTWSSHRGRRPTELFQTWFEFSSVCLVVFLHCGSGLKKRGCDCVLLRPSIDGAWSIFKWMMDSNERIITLKMPTNYTASHTEPDLIHMQISEWQKHCHCAAYQWRGEVCKPSPTSSWFNISQSFLWSGWERVWKTNAHTSLSTRGSWYL